MAIFFDFYISGKAAICNAYKKDRRRVEPEGLVF